MYSMFRLCGDRGRETSLGSCGDPKDTAAENLRRGVYSRERIV